MGCTVKNLAAMSGVSVRTLHYYDEVGLLKPACRGANNYRFYEESQQLTLQQILFFRELGFELKAIQRILGRSDFDRMQALASHREVLRRKIERTRRLMGTIDRTIKHLKGTKKMKSEALFAGFDPKQQAKHEQYLVDRYGKEMKTSITESKRRVKHWTKADWEKSGAAFAAICAELVALMKRGTPAGSRDVQRVIRRHFEWMCQFWTPARESYAGHSELIVDSELRKAYEAHDPRLPEFAAAAIKVFAEELPD